MSVMTFDNPYEDNGEYTLQENELYEDVAEAVDDIYHDRFSLKVLRLLQFNPDEHKRYERIIPSVLFYCDDPVAKIHALFLKKVVVLQERFIRRVFIDELLARGRETAMMESLLQSFPFMFMEIHECMLPSILSNPELLNMFSQILDDIESAKYVLNNGGTLPSNTVHNLMNRPVLDVIELFAQHPEIDIPDSGSFLRRAYVEMGFQSWKLAMARLNLARGFDTWGLSLSKVDRVLLLSWAYKNGIRLDMFGDTPFAVNFIVTYLPLRHWPKAAELLPNLGQVHSVMLNAQHRIREKNNGKVLSSAQVAHLVGSYPIARCEAGHFVVMARIMMPILGNDLVRYISNFLLCNYLDKDGCFIELTDTAHLAHAVVKEANIFLVTMKRQQIIESMDYFIKDLSDQLEAEKKKRKAFMDDMTPEEQLLIPLWTSLKRAKRQPSIVAKVDKS